MSWWLLYVCLALLALLVMVVYCLLTLWQRHIDDQEVARFRADLDTFDSLPFLEDTDAKREDR